MDKKKLENQVLSTNDWGLMAILHEGLIYKFQEAREALELEDYQALAAREENIRSILTELIVIFKLGEGELNKNFIEIYIFLNKLVSQARLDHNSQALDQAIAIISPLKDAFRQRELDTVANIIAGLTYGREDLGLSQTGRGINFKI